MINLCAPGFLCPQSGWFRSASPCTSPHLSIQAHPGMHRSKDHPTTNAHVQEEGLRVVTHAHIPPAGIHEKDDATVEAAKGGFVVGVRYLLQDQRRFSYFRQFERIR